MTQAGIPRLHAWKEASIAPDSLADSGASVELWKGGGGDQMDGVTPLWPPCPQGQERTLWKEFPGSVPQHWALGEPEACGYPRLGCLSQEEVMARGKEMGP